MTVKSVLQHPSISSGPAAISQEPISPELISERAASHPPQLSIIESVSPVNVGMPEMEPDTGVSVSRYEFWPAWFFYTPVVVQSLWHGVKYRNFALPLIANPGIALSGMVGESKHDILSLAGSEAKKWISPFVTLTRTDMPEMVQLNDALLAMRDEGIDFPIVAKPDMGCRGVGVQLIDDEEGVLEYIRTFPLGARYLLQEKAPYDAEAGVFYIRYPGEKKGRVTSITLKYSPFVVGDGTSTLAQLIENDPRAGQLSHLYLPRHQDKLDWVLTEGCHFRLAFAGSHSRGCIFRNGNQYITEQLAERLDHIFDDLPGFHFGRLDVKFHNIKSLMKGEKLTILEINGASSEAAHIWDRNTPLKDIFSTLLVQYRTLYEIGDLQRKAGHKTPSLWALYKAWRAEKALVEHYPATD
jgi:hypothetical protein